MGFELVTFWIRDWCSATELPLPCELKVCIGIGEKFNSSLKNQLDQFRTQRVFQVKMAQARIIKKQDNPNHGLEKKEIDGRLRKPSWTFDKKSFDLK